MTHEERIAGIRRSLHALRAARKTLGLCRECGNRKPQGRLMCCICAAKHAEDSAKYKRKARAQWPTT